MRIYPLRGWKRTVFAALFLCSCASPIRSQENAATARLNPTLERRDARYRLCASDVIGLTFPLTPEFDQTVTVQPDGYATLAGAGDIRLAGLTTKESAEAVRAAYAKILHDPVVAIELKDFNKPYFIVGGQVNHPGKFDLRGPTSAAEALAIAGGLNDFAKHSQVLLFRRENADWYQVKPLNLKRILEGRDVNEDPELLPGDMLFVPTIAHLQERDPKSIPAVYRESYRLVFFLAVPAFTSLAVLSPLISRFWIGRYEPVFVEFVALLAGAWLVNALCNPAYVVDLGTGALRWVSIGCMSTVVLNGGLGFVAGSRFGGVAVVAAAAFSLVFGYLVILVVYHLENRVPFAALLPKESVGILALSALCVLASLLLFRHAPASSRLFARAAPAAISLLFVVLVGPMWAHPMRKRLIHWVFERVPA